MILTHFTLFFRDMMILMQNRVMKATKAITARVKGESSSKSVFCPRSGWRELEELRDLGTTD